MTREDEADLKQEMALGLVLRLPHFDPARASLRTYVSHVLDGIASDFNRSRKREKRDYRLELYSLNECIDDGEGGRVGRGELVSQDEHNFRLGNYTSPATEREDMRLDVWVVVCELPPHLKDVAKLLMKYSISETARRLGLHRDTIHRDRIPKLREFFEERGLKDYF